MANKIPERLIEVEPSEKYAERIPTLNYLKLDNLREGKATLALIGDEHIGSKYYDADTHHEHVVWCLKHKIPVILMGDELECATRDSVGAGVYEQQEIIDQQLEHFLKVYTPLARAGLILGIHHGNHEMRLWKSSGVNLTRIMAQMLGVHYWGVGKLHYIRVGEQSYTLYTTHGAGGARLPHTKMKKCFDLAQVADAEIYAMGHVHAMDYSQRTFYRIDRRNKTVGTEKKHFILTGCYLRHWGSYAHQANMEPVSLGSPKLKLHADEHRIRVSLG